MGASSAALGKKMAVFQEACRKQGLKLTHQRLEVYRQLAAATDHPSAETLYKRLRTLLPTLSLDTVYRTLATLEEHGLVKKVDTKESQARYEAEMQPHHHAICRCCKKILDFQWPDFDQIPLPGAVDSFDSIQERSIVLYGICQQCGRKGSPG